MIEDEVMQQVRAAKEAFASSHGYYLRWMIEALRKMDEESGVPTVRLEPRKPEVQLPVITSSSPSLSIGTPAPATMPTI